MNNIVNNESIFSKKLPLDGFQNQDNQILSADKNSKKSNNAGIFRRIVSKIANTVKNLFTGLVVHHPNVSNAILVTPGIFLLASELPAIWQSYSSIEFVKQYTNWSDALVFSFMFVVPFILFPIGLHVPTLFLNTIGRWCSLKEVQVPKVYYFKPKIALLSLFLLITLPFIYANIFFPYGTGKLGSGYDYLNNRTILINLQENSGKLSHKFLLIYNTKEVLSVNENYSEGTSTLNDGSSDILFSRVIHNLDWKLQPKLPLSGTDRLGGASAQLCLTKDENVSRALNPVRCFDINRTTGKLVNENKESEGYIVDFGP